MKFNWKNNNLKLEKPVLNKPILPFILLILIIIIGATGYNLLWQSYEGSFLDSIYMTFITITTTGLGEIHPLDAKGRIFTIIISVFGIGSLFYVLSVLMENLVIIQINNYRGKRKKMKKISELENHIILVGFGRVGSLAAQFLAGNKEKFIVIDDNFTGKKSLDLDDNILIYEGDATDDNTLISCGIKKAKAMIVATANSATTVFVILSAKVLNPDLFIVARADFEKDVEKMRRAGADKIVNPYSIGGEHLARLALFPTIADFIDTHIVSSKGKLNIDIILLPFESKWLGKTLKEMNIRNKTGASILAILNHEEPILNPGADYLIKIEDRMVVLGNDKQLEELRRLIN